MRHIMRQSTWSVLLRGVIAITLGIFALTYPRMTLSILVGVFGIYVFINGLLAIIFSLYGRQYQDRNWWFYLAEGVFGLVIGIIVFSLPIITSLVLIYIIAFWAIVTGLIQIFAYIKLQKIFHHETLILISGLLSLIIGIILFRFPLGGIMTVTWILGLYVLIYGILCVVSAFGARYKI